MPGFKSSRHAQSILIVDDDDDLRQQLARAFARRGYEVRSAETQERAITVYEQLGYQRWGSHPRYAWINGRWYTGLYYVKDLVGMEDAPPA